MKLKKIKKQIMKLPIEKQLKLSTWFEKFLNDPESNPSINLQKESKHE